MHHRPLFALVLATLLPACLDAGAESAPEALDFVAERSPASLEIAHPASGWMEIERSPLVPWCGAVLIAPDVALTATDCLQGVYRDEISAGFGNPERDRAIPVIEVEALPGDRLVALVLEEPVVGVEPASFTPVSPTCDTTGISYEHTVRGESVERWTWSGCVDPSTELPTLKVEQGQPNCHGEGGAGVFSNAELVGVVIGGHGPGCIDTVEMATLATDAAAIERALDRSAPPV